ncbi:hypothetical protein N0V85_002942, partial [Neurospora sp. IMI 360204]
MVPSGNSRYRVLRLLLYSAVDVGKPRTMQMIGRLYDLWRLDRSGGASEAKIVYALETGERSDGMGEGEGEEKGLEGFMKLQI